MWRTVKCNAGSVDMQFKGANTNNAEDSVAIIDYGDRKGGSVTLDWNRRSMLNFAMPFYLPADCWQYLRCFRLPCLPCLRISVATSARLPWLTASVPRRVTMTRLPHG